MLKARTNHASSALNGEIYVIGGKAALSVVPLRAPSPPLCSLGASQSCSHGSPPPHPPWGPESPHAGPRDDKGTATHPAFRGSRSGVNRTHARASGQAGQQNSHRGGATWNEAQACGSSPPGDSGALQGHSKQDESVSRRSPLRGWPPAASRELLPSQNLSRGSPP